MSERINRFCGFLLFPLFWIIMEFFGSQHLFATQQVLNTPLYPPSRGEFYPIPFLEGRFHPNSPLEGGKGGVKGDVFGDLVLGTQWSSESPVSPGTKQSFKLNFVSKLEFGNKLKNPTKKYSSQASTPTKGIWISREEIAALPTTGKAWQNVKSEADQRTGKPDISDQNDPTNVRVMAKALVYVRTGDACYRQEVIDACMAAIGTEEGGRTLALGRELIAYVIAADLVELPADQDQAFRAWLRQTLTETLAGRTLVSTHEDRPNNWGTHAGGSRLAVAAYLGDQAELDRAAKVFKGWLGDRASYAAFKYGDLDWQANPSQPVGINPKGATKNGRSIDGVLPDDQRRGGGFKWPPPKENYVYEGLQGALAQAVILHRAGYDVWNWQDQALLRAFKWLHEQANYPAQGDDTWQPHIINYYYDTNFPAPAPSQPGKNVGWTDWTHGQSGGDSSGITAIYGNVLDANSRAAISDALLQLLANNTVRYETKSDNVGSFSFPSLVAGSYRLVCSKSGYQTQTSDISISDGQQIYGREILLARTADTTPPLPPTNVRVFRKQ